LLVVGSLYPVGAFDLPGIALHSPHFELGQALAAIENEKLVPLGFHRS
jgi:hypothetical protein